MHSLCVCMICLNHRDELDRSILDLDSKRKGQISMLRSQRQTRHRSVVANFFFGPTFDLEFLQTLRSKVKLGVFNPFLTALNIGACVNFDLN